uniref:Follistatin-related protein 1 n=1 Tax=Kryptolebias marmoratus TaxID=37003 RepID=A0A3Q3AGD0_KRYMA
MLRSTLFVCLSKSVCARTFCGAGRECVSTDRGEPVCRCLQVVCGSDDRSYRNHCELHRHACITQKKIHVERRGQCEGKLTKADVSPIACFLSDRDLLRERVIEWIQSEVELDHLANDVLQMYFQTYNNGDSQLDLKEFLLFLKHNETLNLTFSDSVEMDLLLRSLCVDALIELSDENGDWKLSLNEFINCLTPTYRPPERRNNTHRSGQSCNLCVCACGSWVCTALTCHGESKLLHVHTLEALSATFGQLVH